MCCAHSARSICTPGHASHQETAIRLALYSDQEIAANAPLDARVMQLIGSQRRRIGYVSAAPDLARTDFERKRAYYERLDAELVVYVDAESTDLERNLAALTACDAIHLSGGNTFELLHWLKQRDVLPVLRDYASNDRGVLIGVSAGAILMTPSVETALLCGDQRLPGEQDDEALSLVPFHFWPHYTPRARRDVSWEPGSPGGRVLYGCEDGSGIIVDGERIEFLGSVCQLP